MSTARIRIGLRRYRMPEMMPMHSIIAVQHLRQGAVDGYAIEDGYPIAVGVITETLGPSAAFAALARGRSEVLRVFGVLVDRYGFRTVPKEG